MEPGRAALRDAVGAAALQGRERRGDTGQHRQRQVQVRVALQGGHHGGHQAPHVDLQEGPLVSRYTRDLIHILREDLLPIFSKHLHLCSLALATNQVRNYINVIFGGSNLGSNLQRLIESI